MRGNSAQLGGAVYAFNTVGSVSLSACALEDNSASATGGAARARWALSPFLTTLRRGSSEN